MERDSPSQKDHIRFDKVRKPGNENPATGENEGGRHKKTAQTARQEERAEIWQIE